MSADPVPEKYKSGQDIVKHEWNIKRVGDEVVGQLALSQLTFTVNRPAAIVWRYLKDRNAWMDDLLFSGDVGEESEGKTISFTVRETYYGQYQQNVPGFDPKSFKKTLLVRKSIPEKLIVTEALSADGKQIVSYYVYTLHEHNGKTTVTGLMAYAPQSAPLEEEDRMRARFQSSSNDVEERWKSGYIPRLRQLVENHREHVEGLGVRE